MKAILIGEDNKNRENIQNKILDDIEKYVNELKPEDVAMQLKDVQFVKNGFGFNETVSDRMSNIRDTLFGNKFTNYSKNLQKESKKHK